VATTVEEKARYSRGYYEDAAAKEYAVSEAEWRKWLDRNNDPNDTWFFEDHEKEWPKLVHITTFFFAVPPAIPGALGQNGLLRILKRNSPQHAYQECPITRQLIQGRQLQAITNPWRFWVSRSRASAYRHARLRWGNGLVINPQREFVMYEILPSHPMYFHFHSARWLRSRASAAAYMALEHGEVDTSSHVDISFIWLG